MTADGSILVQAEHGEQIMSLLNQAAVIKNVRDMIQVARSLVDAVNDVQSVNKELQEYVSQHPIDVPLELYGIIGKMNSAVSKF